MKDGHRKAMFVLSHGHDAAIDQCRVKVYQNTGMRISRSDVVNGLIRLLSAALDRMEFGKESLIDVEPDSAIALALAKVCANSIDSAESG